MRISPKPLVPSTIASRSVCSLNPAPEDLRGRRRCRGCGCGRRERCSRPFDDRKRSAGGPTRPLVQRRRGHRFADGAVRGGSVCLLRAVPGVYPGRAGPDSARPRRPSPDPSTSDGQAAAAATRPAASSSKASSPVPTALACAAVGPEALAPAPAAQRPPIRRQATRCARRPEIPNLDNATLRWQRRVRDLGKSDKFPRGQTIGSRWWRVGHGWLAWRSFFRACVVLTDLRVPLLARMTSDWVRAPSEV